MKTTNVLKTLLTFVKHLQTQGCIVSQTGHIAMPFRVTKKALSVTTEKVRAADAKRLARWIKSAGLTVRSGELGHTNVVLMKDDVLICKIVVGREGFQLRPTKNWAKPKAQKAKSRKLKAAKIPTRAKLLKRQSGRAH